MLTKKTIFSLWGIAYREFLNNEDDNRKNHEVTVDFAIQLIKSETETLSKALTDTNQLIYALLSDPKMPEDQKQLMRQRMEANKNILKIESEAKHV